MAKQKKDLGKKNEFFHVIKISYDGGHEVEQKDCPFRDSHSGSFGPYCSHPFADESKIYCAYGLTQINVPEECPLRESPLISKIELIKGDRVDSQ